MDVDEVAAFVRPAGWGTGRDQRGQRRADPQPRRRSRCSRSRCCRGCGAHRVARHGAALRRRPDLERRGRLRHAARRLRPAVRHAVGLPQQGPGRPGRLARRDRRRAGRRGAGAAQAARRRDAAGRRAGRRRVVRPGAPAGPAGRGPPAGQRHRRGARGRARWTPTSCRWT
jgi:hypothetical protein